MQELLHRRAGVLIVAAARGSEVALEMPQLGHGAFTTALLEALHPRQGAATVLDLLAWVARRVPVLTDGRQHTTVPYLQDFDTSQPLPGTAGEAGGQQVK